MMTRNTARLACILAFSIAGTLQSETRLPPPVFGAVAEVADYKTRLLSHVLHRRANFGDRTVRDKYAAAGLAYQAFIDQLSNAVDNPEEPRNAMRAAQVAAQESERLGVSGSEKGDRMLALALAPYAGFAATILSAAAKKVNRPALKVVLKSQTWPTW